MSNDSEIQQAIALAKAGKKEEARAIVEPLVDRDPANAEAWLVLAQVEEDPGRALGCMERVVALRPNDARAGRLMERIQAKQSRSGAEPVHPPKLTVPDRATFPAVPANKSCPFCAETILAEAVVCKHCGRDLVPHPTPAPTRRLRGHLSSVAAPFTEKILLEVRESPWSPLFWIRVIFTIGLYVVAWEARKLVVTTHRVVWRKGVFGKRERTIPLARVQDISVEYGLLGEIFNYGTVHVESAGGPFAEIVASNVAHPNVVREVIFLAGNEQSDIIPKGPKQRVGLVILLGFVVGLSVPICLCVSPTIPFLTGP